MVSNYFSNKNIHQKLQIPFPGIVCTRFSVVLGQNCPSQNMAMEALVRISDHPKVQAANPRFGLFWTLQVTQQIQNPNFEFKFDVISPHDIEEQAKIAQQVNPYSIGNSNRSGKTFLEFSMWYWWVIQDDGLKACLVFDPTSLKSLQRSEAIMKFHHSSILYDLLTSLFTVAPCNVTMWNLAWQEFKKSWSILYLLRWCRSKPVKPSATCD